MRAAAEVLPAPLAGAGVEVVVDGQLGAADLDRLAGVAGLGFAGFCGDAALEADQLQLVRLAGQFLPGLILADDPAAEALALLDDLAHLLLDRLKVVGAERLVHVEVVVEAVLYRRADAQLGLGEQVLHRLRHDMRGRVAQDGQAVRLVDGHRLDAVAVSQLVGQVTRFAVHPRGDRVLAGLVPVGQHLAGRRAVFHHVLASGEGDVKLVGRHGWLLRALGRGGLAWT